MPFCMLRLLLLECCYRLDCCSTAAPLRLDCCCPNYMPSSEPRVDNPKPLRLGHAWPRLPKQLNTCCELIGIDTTATWQTKSPRNPFTQNAPSRLHCACHGPGSLVLSQTWWKGLVMYGLKPTKNFFPECVASSKGSRFTLFGGGAVFATHCTTVRNRLQPSAAVRNRPQPCTWGRYGRAFGEFYESGHFWRFQTSRSLVSPGRRGTLWHSNMFQNLSKVVFCGRRNAFSSFQKMRCTFPGAHSTLVISIVMRAGGRLYLQIWVACTSRFGSLVPPQLGCMILLYFIICATGWHGHWQRIIF